LGFSQDHAVSLTTVDGTVLPQRQHLIECHLESPASVVSGSRRRVAVRIEERKSGALELSDSFGGDALIGATYILRRIKQPFVFVDQ
jgi:hypothetical protein